MKQCPCPACSFGKVGHQPLDPDDLVLDGWSASSSESVAVSALCLNKASVNRFAPPKWLRVLSPLSNVAKRPMIIGAAIFVAVLLVITGRNYFEDETAIYQESAREHTASGRYEQAIALLNEGISKGLNQAELYNELGAIYLKQGNYDKAHEALQKAVGLDNDHRTAHYNLGLYYIKKGQRRAALEQQKILLRLDKEKAEMLYSVIYE